MLCPSNLGCLGMGILNEHVETSLEDYLIVHRTSATIVRVMGYNVAHNQLKGEMKCQLMQSFAHV
ncbi:MAG: Unknown protein [uncultured Thiotrichaceae bacterium]|uniref:Uncharacterized protein n=1 Tax=uncultured Thiotrichaceae bacterium TaxID=298394 RepID=A0A6S6U1E3_9GAMM|nr:MAG: Unknown protein [uncultured Thiotrichaceae bacterium]